MIILNLGFLVEAAQSFEPTPVSELHPRPIKSESFAVDTWTPIYF